MNHVDDLRQRLTDLVEDVDAPPMTGPAWARARARVRRRRVVAGTTGVAVVAGALLSLGVGQGGRWTSDDAPPSDGNVATTGKPALPPESLTLREPATHQGLALRPGVLRGLEDIPATAPSLHDRPATRLVAAVQRHGGPVLVLGSDLEWRVANPGTTARLGQGSVSADGTVLVLVLADADAVEVIDARTGQVERRPADTATTGPAWDVAVGPADGPAVRLDESTVQVGQAPARPLVRGNGKAEPWRANWYGTPASDGRRVARTFFAPENEEQAVGVVDQATGRLTHLLHLPYVQGRSQGCCGVLGWLSDGSLAFSDFPYVLAWDPVTGKIARVARVDGLDAMVVALASGF